MGFVDYMGQNIWLPVLIAVGVALIILVIIWVICRRRGQRRYNQIILDEERSLIQKWDDEKRMQKMAERDAVLLNCYYYLKDSKKYSFIDHLPDIGSRMNKQWFLVRDSKQEINAVLTMVPWSLQCTLTFNKATRKTLKELFSLLQYPYLLPVMDVDFVFEHNLVMFIHPFRSAGSLKDVIYGSRPQSSWEDKYQVKGKSLSVTQIRNYGRQVLEALLYLREKGLPACGHLHSGNIFIINGNAKLSGFENSLFGWKESLQDVQESFTGEGDITVMEADVTDPTALDQLYANLPAVQGAVCCLASRSGGRQDSFDIDYQATVNCIEASRRAGLQQFVLLSAVCVQRPLLAFQEAKLKAEAELCQEGQMAYSIVRPTAFFKSLLGQVKGVKGGAPFVMFGDGTEVRCKPISEEDLASFMADCFWDPAKKNAILPIGGPGPALSFKEQGELLFSLIGEKPNFICVPYGVFDFVQGILDFIAGLIPSQSDLAEYGRIGRYYAEQSMLVLDPATGKYSEELTPSYGRTDLRAFLTDALQEGSKKLESQQLGEQGLGNRLGVE